MKTFKMIPRESRKGHKIGKAYYSKKIADLAVLETNSILNNLTKKA